MLPLWYMLLSLVLMFFRSNLEDIANRYSGKTLNGLPVGKVFLTRFDQADNGDAKELFIIIPGRSKPQSTIHTDIGHMNVNMTTSTNNAEKLNPESKSVTIEVPYATENEESGSAEHTVSYTCMAQEDESKPLAREQKPTKQRQQKPTKQRQQKPTKQRQQKPTKRKMHTQLRARKRQKAPTQHELSRKNANVDPPRRNPRRASKTFIKMTEWSPSESNDNTDELSWSPSESDNDTDELSYKSSHSEKASKRARPSKNPLKLQNDSNDSKYRTHAAAVNNTTKLTTNTNGNKVTPSPWISVDLDQCKDKFKVLKKHSFAQQNRCSKKKQPFYHCLVCGRFESLDSDVFRRHLELHVNGRLTCKTCRYEAHAHIELLNHMKNEHNVDPNSSKSSPLVCDKCGKLFVHKNSLEVHMYTKHNISTCKRCNLQFQSLEEANRHMQKVHPGHAGYTCKLCQRFTIFSRALLRKHAHTCAAKPVKCGLCGKMFSTKENHNLHMNRVHLKVRRFQCNLCPFATYTSARIKLHNMMHAGGDNLQDHNY